MNSNSDIEYLYLDVKFNDACTELTMKLSVFMYTEKLGLDGGSLKGEEALTFLKSTFHGRQPEIINYFWLFTPDTKYEEFGVELVVVIPSIKDVKFKYNLFDRKRRQLKTSMMSIPCVKIPKVDITRSDIVAALGKLRAQTTALKPAAASVFKDMQDIEAELLKTPETISPELQTKMNTAYESYSKQINDLV